MKALILFIAILATTVSAQTIASPNGKLKLAFAVNANGEPTYSLTFNGKPVVNASRVGFDAAIGLRDGFKVVKTASAKHDDTWKPVWGEVASIRNRYSELAATLQRTMPAGKGEMPGPTFRIVLRFRVFDDGIGFRTEFPQGDGLSQFTIEDETTEFALTGDHTAFWIPADTDSQEYFYTKSRLSEVDALAVSNRTPEIAVRTPVGKNVVQTPLMLKTADGLYINIHEAALVDYPAMYARIDGTTLTTTLAKDANGHGAVLQTPAKTPWRTIVVSDKASDILASKLILNLNEPSKVADTSWIKPRKFVGVWWEMHVDKATWNYSSDGTPIEIGKTDWNALKPNGKHGATTANVKRYIDFASRNGIDAVLVEGWNVGWEDWFGKWKENVFDFVTPYPDFDVAEIERYAAAKGVRMIMHHETSGSASNYDRRLDSAFGFMKEHGYDAVKTGYVGKIIPRGEHHDGQWMINHYNRVAEKAAARRIMVDAHEPVRPTGLSRTWPNWMASEAARGNEFNAWSVGNPPEHETILPFTRLMGGPMDYTPGIFEIKRSFYDPKRSEQVHTTLVKQLALYVTIYSPLQMAADLPENYEKRMDAFQFIKDVAVDWDDTRIVEAEPGDYVTIARKAKGRDEWYVGAITDENPRTSSVDLGFLKPGKTYTATVYADAPDADWKSNPMAYKISTIKVTSKSKLSLKLAPGGGAAVRIS